MENEEGVLQGFIKKAGIKRIIIIGLCGMALLVLSIPEGIFSKEKSKDKEIVNEESIEYDDSYGAFLENKLENVLEKIPEVGNVTVMITLQDTGEREVLKENTNVSSNTQKDNETVVEDSSSEKAVFEENGSDKMPYVINRYEPKVEGVVVIATGNISSKNINDINDAIKALFNVPAHKIKVIKGN